MDADRLTEIERLHANGNCLSCIEGGRCQRKELLAEVRRLRDGIRELHRPHDEVAEVFHDQPWEDCPDGAVDDCPGHEVDMQVCRECGHTFDVDAVAFRPWPCPTVELFDGEKPS